MRPISFRPYNPMRLSRREILTLPAATLALGHGMATRNVAARKRGKPFGPPFLERFADIGAQAGLRHPTLYGPLEHKDYIIRDSRVRVRVYRLRQ
jgi:hypothetical protein